MRQWYDMRVGKFLELPPKWRYTIGVSFAKPQVVKNLEPFVYRLVLRAGCRYNKTDQSDICSGLREFGGRYKI